MSAIAASACGSSSGPASTPARSHTFRVHHTNRAATARPSVGVTKRLNASGTTLLVTVIRVIDPLGDSGAALLAGTRAVGVLMRIQNHGPGIYDSSATGDVSVVPSSGTATPVFAPHGTCQTPLRDFDNYISAGEVRSGCVAFAVANGAKVRSVRFSPHGQATGRGTWLTAG